MPAKNEIQIQGNGNIILQDVKGSTIHINPNNTEEMFAMLQQLHAEQLDALAQVVEKETGKLGTVLPTLLSGILAQKNIVKGSISQVKGDVNIGDKQIRNYYVVYQEKAKAAKELTLHLPRLRANQIVGRGADVKDLHDRLFQHKQVVLVNGMGGIGKTTLAQVYLTTYYEQYQHIAWIALDADRAEVMADFVNAEGLLSRFSIQQEGKTIPELFADLLGKLKALDHAPCLMVLDNATSSLTAIQHYLPNPPNWHVLVTSREQIPEFDVKELGFLRETEAIALFRLHYQHRQLTDDFLRTLVTELEYHTLTIEILAKTAQEQRSNPETLLHALQNDLETDVAVRHKKSGKVAKILSYLLHIFKTSKLNENEQWLLLQFICLPPQAHTFELLQTLIHKTNTKPSLWAKIGGFLVGKGWNRPTKQQPFHLAKTLASLAKKGWVLYNQAADTYKMHRIIVDVVEAAIPLKEKAVATLIKTVTFELHIDQTKDNPIDKFKWIPFGKAILYQFESATSHAISHLQNNLAVVLQDLGDYAGAKGLLEKALISAEQNFGASHPTTAVRYSNLALVLQALGDYAGAKGLLEKALISAEQNFGASHPTTAVGYSNLALVLQALGDYAGAKGLLEKALISAERNFGASHPTTAVRYSNLALVLQDLGDYAGAKGLLEKAYTIMQKAFEETHPYHQRAKNNLLQLLHLIELKKDKK